MSSGRVSTVAKPPGRRASDAGRSRLADYTRPIARAQRITRSRRPAFAGGLIGLLVVVTIGAALFGLPLRTWFAQDDELTQLEIELDELTAVNADLAEEVAALQTEDGVVRAARDSLGVTRFGERRQTVIGVPELPTDLPDGWPYAAVERMIALLAEQPEQP
jgi:cell division protein FtsB